MDSDYYYYYFNDRNLINYTNYLVGNTDELKETLLFISNEFQNIKDSSSKIKRYKNEKVK